MKVKLKVHRFNSKRLKKYELHLDEKMLIYDSSERNNGSLSFTIMSVFFSSFSSLFETDENIFNINYI